MVEELELWLERWRRSEPGSYLRRRAADEIERLERELFGSRPHALGKPLEGGDNGATQ